MSSEHTPAGRASEATPGPWRAVGILSGSENSRGYSVRTAVHGIAEVWPLDQDGREGKANATLIARAPQLRDALRELLAANGPLTGSGVRRERAEEQAKAALEGL